MRNPPAKKWISLLEKRRDEVAKVRHKLRADCEEFEMLKESCERAYNDMQAAIDALSELA